MPARIRGWSVTALLALTAGVAQAQPRASFTLAGYSVPAGQRSDFDIAVPAGAADTATVVPVTVFHGAAPGPVLALTAGVHGFEYTPILAAQKLLARLDPARLRGTVILVRLAHVEAFLQRVPYVNPFDRKNLNRVFPGSPSGTQTDRIAWALTTEVIRRSDLHIELHGGDAAEWMEPFAGPYGGPLAAAHYDQARAMALALGFRNVIKYSMHTQAQVDRGRSLNRQAVADGKPTVLVEIGENGRRDDAFVDALVAGLENVLRVLKMSDGVPTPPRADTRWLDVGTVTDFAGRVIERIVAPVDGYVMYGLAGPPVRAGDSVATIGLLAKAPL